MLPDLVPADEVFSFRGKYPKAFRPWHDPSGDLYGSLTPVVRKLAVLKQCAPFSPESAALIGHATMPVSSPGYLEIQSDGLCWNEGEY